MTFVKLMFALLIMAPIAVLMWYLVNKLITEFTDSVKKSRDEERTKGASSRELNRGSGMERKRYAYHESKDIKPPKDADQERTQESEPSKGKKLSRVKSMADKRKRRKERQTKRMNSTKKDKE